MCQGTQWEAGRHCSVSRHERVLQPEVSYRFLLHSRPPGGCAFFVIPSASSGSAWESVPGRVLFAIRPPQRAETTRKILILGTQNEIGSIKRTGESSSVTILPFLGYEKMSLLRARNSVMEMPSTSLKSWYRVFAEENPTKEAIFSTE